MTDHSKLSVIMALLNEEEILEAAIENLSHHLDDCVGEGNWQLIPVDNGSTDRTPQILDQFAKKWPATRHLRLEEKNIGKAMKHGLLHADYSWAMILPIDEFDPKFLRWAWDNHHDYDLVLGSKRVDPTLNQQTAYRRLLSWGLNALLQLTLDNVTADTHGAKLLNLDVVKPIIKSTVISRGQFDTEVTLRSLRKGLRIAEIPVRYEEKRAARNWMLTKIGRNVVDLYRLNKALRAVPFADRIRYRRFSLDDVDAL